MLAGFELGNPATRLRALPMAMLLPGPSEVGEEPWPEPPAQGIRHRDDAGEPLQEPWGRPGDMGHGSQWGSDPQLGHTEPLRSWV